MLECDNNTWDLIEKACKEAGKRKRDHAEKGQSLLERLLDCFVDSVEGAPSDKRFRHGVHLLDKIVLQDNLSTLIVNFYPVNEGYSLMLKSPSGTESETIRLPYEETEFLDYLDAQQLPPMLVDLLEKSKANVFYNGCVVVEVRDYRCSVNPSSYDTSYVLLRPTCQTLVADVNALTCDGEWRDEDKINLEAELLLKTQSPLCLDPSPDVFNIVNHMHFHKNKYRTKLLQRSHKRRFRSYISQNHSILPAPSSLKLVDFLAHHKHAQPPVNLRLSKSSYSGVDTWKQRALSLAPPTEPVQVMKFAKKIEPSKIDPNSAPETVQEIVLEATESTDNRNHHCRVTIQRRPADLQYLGELYLHEDAASKEITQDKGKCCKFFLGSKLSAQRYLQQFQDLYTEEGRKFVKISSYIPTKQAMLQAQMKNKVKAEPNRTPSPCQGPDNKTNAGIVKTQSHPNSGNKMTVNAVVKNDGTNQTIAGKIPIYNTASSLAGTNSGVVMTGTTVQGKQYVTAIPVASSSVQNQHETIQPGASYQQNVVGAYVQPKVVALGNTAIPVVTTPIAPNISKTNSGARPSLLQPKFITANIKNGAQPIQSAGPGSITLIQSAGGDQTRRLLPSSIASRILKKQPHNVTIQGQPVQIAQRSNNATIAQLSSAGILPLGINVANAQLSGKKVAQQQAVTLPSSLTQPLLQQQAQARQLTAGAPVNTSTAVTMVTIGNAAAPIANMTSAGTRSGPNLTSIVPLQQQHIQVRMVPFPQGTQTLQPRQITVQPQVNPTNTNTGRTPGRPNLRRRSSHQSNNSQK